ncbi:hypothetical protein NQ317_008662 [Molorchus minor]|uniref:Uncharacterized protein n=1 Tax=Molorchus minor TaxID=1323400 RepID=A0ABQ9K386_9CUCU|nr:hypothetical protein NQ317_008662 [Molorchus minor]
MLGIRRMQEMLKQMQEKLKVDAQDNKKHESIIDVLDSYSTMISTGGCLLDGVAVVYKITCIYCEFITK